MMILVALDLVNTLNVFTGEDGEMVWSSYAAENGFDKKTAKIFLTDGVRSGIFRTHPAVDEAIGWISLNEKSGRVIASQAPRSPRYSREMAKVWLEVRPLLEAEPALVFSDVDAEFVVCVRLLKRDFAGHVVIIHANPLVHDLI